MKDILVATDGSRSGTAAVEEGLTLAQRLGVGLTFVTVHRTPSRILGDPFYERRVGEALRDAHAVVQEAHTRAAAMGIRADVEVLEGNAADEIVALADNRDAEMIVIGSRGHSPLVGALLGSVSAGVVQHARRPVVIVNPGPPAENAAGVAA
jgi:nucleotide-binding universal stress UspA family protein